VSATITLQPDGFAVCSCGNDVMQDGFAPVNAAGHPAEPEVGGFWDGHLRCETCNLVALPEEVEG